MRVKRQGNWNRKEQETIQCCATEAENLKINRHSFTPRKVTGRARVKKKRTSFPLPSKLTTRTVIRYPCLESQGQRIGLQIPAPAPEQGWREKKKKRERKTNSFTVTPCPGFLSMLMFYKCLYLASSCFSFNAATRLPAMQGHKLCYAIDYVTYHMISCFCFTFISQLIKTPLCLCSRLSFLDANPLSWCVPQINNPPVLHISLSGPEFPTPLPHWPILGIMQGQKWIYHAAKEA